MKLNEIKRLDEDFGIVSGPLLLGLAGMAAFNLGLKISDAQTAVENAGGVKAFAKSVIENRKVKAIIDKLAQIPEVIEAVKKKVQNLKEVIVKFLDDAERELLDTVMGELVKQYARI